MADMATSITQEQIYTAIKSLVGQANILTIPREFIDYTGDMESALLLSQIIYWSDKTKRGDGFIYKTYAEWQEETGLNEYAIRKAANCLKSLGILETEVHKANGSPTVHYRLITSKFSVSFLQNLKERNFKIQSIESSKFKESLTETTTEITSEITDNDNASSQESRSSFISEIIQKYFEVYRRVMNKEHPALKENQLACVKLEIAKFADEFCCDEPSPFDEMIEWHFARTDGLKTDFNINHFATRGIMQNLFYQHCY